MNSKRSRLIMITSLSLLLVAIMLLSLLPENREDPFSSLSSVVFRPWQKGSQAVLSGLQTLRSAWLEARDLKTENERLKEENVALRLQIKDNEQAAAAYADLKEAFKLKSRFEFQEFQASHVLNNKVLPGADLLRLDVGTSDGVDLASGKQYPVVDQYANLAGRIYASDLLSSKLLPIWHEGFAMNCRSEGDTQTSFRLRGDAKAKQEGLLLADQIPEEARLKIGDSLISTGLGGIYPPGLRLGTVLSIEASAIPGERQAKVKPYFQVSEERVLFVLLGDREGPDAQESVGIEGTVQP